MKYNCLLALTAATVTTAHAGSPPPEEPMAPPPAAEPWIKPTLDIRARFEYGETNGYAPAYPAGYLGPMTPAGPMVPIADATAFTTRERLGLVTKDWYGFSALVEGEFTQAIGDAYDSAPTPFAVQTTEPNPFFPRTLIADPETNELNQAYIQYKGFDTTIKGGRQRIKLDNDAFVGNVGWRQNEQTYDGATISNQSVDGLTLFYGYANRANRIFGSDATGALRNFAGDIHLFNARYEGIPNTVLTGYAYFMDFDETAARGGYISNNTFGAIAQTKLDALTLRGEFAYQTDADSTPVAVAGNPVEDASYFHLNADYAMGAHALGLGWEYLSADFVTPLATVHAFNGFADVFINQRIGLVENPGLSDLYLKHNWKLPFWGLNFTQFVHLFGDNNSDFDYGWEYDAVLAKKFNDNFLAIAKFAYFDSEGAMAGPISNPAPFDTTRFTLELNYTF